MGSVRRQEYSFSLVPRAEIPRSMFNRSHCYKTAFDCDDLVPFYVDEALPGDTFNCRVSLFARVMSPMIVPVMDNVYLDVFFFFVPNRLVWTNWQKFCGEQLNPGDSTSYLIPQVPCTAQNLADYMGVFCGANSIAISSLFMRSYAMTWNEWFRDQNLQTRTYCPTGDGPDAMGDGTTGFTVMKRCKRPDYFTSCLPWPQKGTEVTLPLGTTATVKTNPTDLLTGAQSPMRVLQATAGAVPGVAFPLQTGPAGVTPEVSQGAVSPGGSGARLYPSNLFADLSTATAATINAIRQAFQIQKLLERDARGGTRYIEILKSHFGVTSPDARLQRPEYLGGGTIPVIVNPVAQTSNTPVTGTAQGNLAAYGLSSHQSLGFTKSFVEHGTILGLVAARADVTYSQGVQRMFKRRTRYDFYWPALAHLGEQAVLNREIFAQGDNVAADTQTFGYQERWAEYRYFPSMLTGPMRPDYVPTANFWHLAENFGALPVLNNSFIKSNTPMDRAIAVPSQPHFLFDSYIDIRCARPMPMYSVPGLIDHF